MPESEPKPGAVVAASLERLVEDGVLVVAVTRRGRITGTSPAFDAIFGLPTGGAHERTFDASFAEADRMRIGTALDAAGRSERGAGNHGRMLTVDAIRADGSRFEAELLVAPCLLADGPATVVLVTDVTERQRAHKQLSKLAFNDLLTGLPNRAQFLDRLGETLAMARRDGRTFAVMMCDLDGFKEINDTFGHDADDVTLRAVARRLEGAVRESDMVARFGGDEFAIILAKLAREADATVVAERMLRAFDAPIEHGRAACSLGLSIGIAVFPAAGADIDSLVVRADAAMYASKRAGKHRFTCAVGGAAGASPVQAPLLRWSDEHAIGVDLIDRQHGRLFGLLNGVAEARQAGRVRELIDAMRELERFAAEHFGTEERLMQQVPGFQLEAAHAREHRSLLEEFGSLGVDGQSMTLTMHILHEWLLSHIDVMDRPLGVWLRDHGVS